MAMERDGGFGIWDETELDDESYSLFDLPEGAAERFEEKQRALRRSLRQAPEEHDSSPSTSEDDEPVKAETEADEGRRRWRFTRKRGQPPADLEGALPPAIESQENEPAEQARTEIMTIEEGHPAAAPAGRDKAPAVSASSGGVPDARSEAAAKVVAPGGVNVTTKGELDPWAEFLADEPAASESPKDDIPPVEDTRREVVRLIRAWLSSDTIKVGREPDIDWRGKTLARRAKSLQKGGFDACHDDYQLVLRLPALLAYIGSQHPSLSERDVVESLYALGYERKRTRGIRFWTGPMMSHDGLRLAA